MASAYAEGRCACFWDYLVNMTRLWGVLTAAVMSGVGVDLLYHGHGIGTCVLIGSLLVFFLEISWAIQLFMHVCLRPDEGGQPGPTTGAACACFGACLRWWDKPSKKGMLFVVLGVVILLWPQHRLWLSPVAGVMLLLLAGLYFLLTLKARGGARETLLRGRDESFDRFDDTSDVLDDSLPEPIAVGHPPDDSPQRFPSARTAAVLVVPPPDDDAEAPEGQFRTTDAGRHSHALVDGFGDQEIILRM